MVDVSASENGVRPRTKWMAVLAVTIICGMYLGPFVRRGWVHHDAGLIGHSAERVLNGELPHRDFNDMYTGGLSMAQALVFRTFGIDLLAIRVVTAVAALTIFPIIFLIAARFTTLWQSALITFMTLVWSLPNYFSGLPSWPMLILCFWALAAVVKFIDTAKLRWLFVAGIFIGISLLIKLTGLYAVAAVFLFLLAYEQFTSRSSASLDGPSSSGTSKWIVKCFTGLIAVVFGCLVVILIRQHITAGSAQHFLLPNIAVCLFLIYNESRCMESDVKHRLLNLARSCGVFSAGVAIPVGLFLFYYAANGALSDLYDGVVVKPRLRFAETFADFEAPLFATLPVVAAMMVVLFWKQRSIRSEGAVNGPVRSGRAVLILVSLAMLLLANGRFYFDHTWFVFRTLTPFVIVASLLVVAEKQTHPDTTHDRQRMILFMLACMTSVMSLTQYPASYRAYFTYISPLMILTLVGGISLRHGGLKWRHLVFLTFFTLFGTIHLNSGFAGFHKTVERRFTRDFNMPRANIVVSEQFYRMYSSLIPRIHEETSPDDYIFATPDCPDIYFLSGRRNPTPFMYDFFDDRADRGQQLVRMIEEKKIRVVVVNRNPVFTDAIPQELHDYLNREFNHFEKHDWFILAVRAHPSDAEASKPAH